MQSKTLPVRQELQAYLEVEEGLESSDVVLH